MSELPDHDNLPALEASSTGNPPTDQGTDAVQWLDNVPISREYGDVYYCKTDGLEESRYVFLRHNRLEERLRTLRDTPDSTFCVGETGFGTGLNFLALWSLWQQRGFKHASLHFISVEKHPLPTSVLARAHRAWPTLAPLAKKLRAVLPIPYPGFHRCHLAAERIVLTLLYGDAATMLSDIGGGVDAWFLDGFAPAKNPEVWTPTVFSAIARASRRGTTFATFTCAGEVRRGLKEMGFQVEKGRGYKYKREMCFGHFLSGEIADTEHNNARLPVSCAPWFRHAVPAHPPRTAIVIGGGLAGCATAYSLAQRGVQVTVLDQADRLASAASGNPVGLTFVRLTTHNSAQNRYYLNAYLYALGKLRSVFEEAGIQEGEHWRLNGILRVFDDPQDAAETLAFLETDNGHLIAETLSADELSARAGFRIDLPGIFQFGSGWLNPATLCGALVNHPLIKVMTCSQAISLTRNTPDRWQVNTATDMLQADAVILANSTGIADFIETSHLSLRTVRGQLTKLFPTDESKNLQHAINYRGYLTPVWQGTHTLGATFHPKRKDSEETLNDHIENLSTLEQALPHFSTLPGIYLQSPASTPSCCSATQAAANLPPLTGRVAFRAGTPDYLPYVGPVPDVQAYADYYQEGLNKGLLKRLYPQGPLHPQLYVNVGHGSRGITSTLLASEILCHWMFNEPAPVDREILHALHPARFLIRDFKRRKVKVTE